MSNFDPDDIDPEILDIITDINEIGAKTEFCCAGYGPHSKNDIENSNKNGFISSHGIASLAFKKYHPFLERLIKFWEREGFEYIPLDPNDYNPLYCFYLRNSLPYIEWPEEKKELWKTNKEVLYKKAWDKIRGIIKEYKNAQ